MVNNLNNAYFLDIISRIQKRIIISIFEYNFLFQVFENSKNDRREINILNNSFQDVWIYSSTL